MAEPTTDPAQPRSALDVLFDLRVIIALLFAIYGLVCLVWGLAFTDAEQLSKSGGIHLNLWAGIGMLAGAAGFAGWALLRPLRPRTAPDASGASVSGGQDARLPEQI